MKKTPATSLPVLFPRSKWWIPALILVLMILAAIFAPLWTPQDPYDLATVWLEDADRAPTWLDHPASGIEGERKRGIGLPLFLLGADGQGRDVLSAIAYGLRVSLLVGTLGTLIAGLAGVTLGLIAGWGRRWTEAIIMRLADIQLSFPSVLIALFIMAVWGQGIGKIIFAVAVAHWVIYARVVRGRVLVEREKDYIAAVRALGAGDLRIVLLHILPNIATPVLVISSVEFASVVMLEAMLSFLGLGVPLTQPSLGMLIKFGYDDFFSGNWWVWLFPGLTLMMLVYALNWLADSLREKYLLPGEG